MFQALISFFKTTRGTFLVSLAAFFFLQAPPNISPNKLLENYKNFFQIAYTGI